MLSKPHHFLLIHGECGNHHALVVHIKVAEGIAPLLRRPISICNVDQEKNEFTMLYRAEGQGTKTLATRKQGEMVDVLGPLGHGFPVEEPKEDQTKTSRASNKK